MSVRKSRRGEVEPFYAMELMKFANIKSAEGADVISLCLGQPSDGAPAPVLEAAARALASGSALGYTDASGLIELREQIASHYLAYYGVEVD
ncbi:MAG: aminotransferase class I/II-fold pyridoxal phosphate-dependent enzyme, partial [Propionibacteriaceae bacterium]|nr:aminotransferase class I/II-fold pyridoxal phosphate-dependent enzyme [Propionibacteriaceae bacterium]